MIYMEHKVAYPCSAPFREDFYDGHVDIEDKVCEIPDNKPAWVLRLEGLGFAIIPEERFRQARGLPLKETFAKTPRQPRS